MEGEKVKGWEKGERVEGEQAGHGMRRHFPPSTFISFTFSAVEGGTVKGWGVNGGAWKASGPSAINLPPSIMFQLPFQQWKGRR